MTGIRFLALAVLPLSVLALGAGRVHAQAEGPTNFVTPPASDYVVEGPSSRLELVLEDGARGPTDLGVLTSAGQLPCHLPCTLNVPSGMVHLIAQGLDQRFELQLPVARFRVRSGEPVPWVESIAGMAAGLALGGVGTWAALTSVKEDEVAGGIALVALGTLLFGLSLVVIIIGVIDQNGSVELDTFEAALREGTLARF